MQWLETVNKKKLNNFFIVTPKQKSLKSSDLCHSIMLFLYFMKWPGTLKKSKFRKIFYNHAKVEICKKEYFYHEIEISSFL